METKKVDVEQQRRDRKMAVDLAAFCRRVFPINKRWPTLQEIKDEFGGVNCVLTTLRVGWLLQESGEYDTLKAELEREREK